MRYLVLFFVWLIMYVIFFLVQVISDVNESNVRYKCVKGFSYVSFIYLVLIKVLLYVNR